MQPLVTESPHFTLTGTGSPVIGEVSSRLSPSVTVLSSGILSPGRISRISPVRASSAAITEVPSDVIRVTVSGRISTASIICPRLRSTALCSKYSPIL